MAERNECRFPPHLDEPWAGALREAVQLVVDRFDPIGIVAAGSPLRGEAGPTSDLDVYVVHRAPWRQRLQRRFGGVPCEIFVNPPDGAREYLRDEQRTGRLITAHMLSTGFVVLDRDPEIATLRREATGHLSRAPVATPADVRFRRYAAACSLDDATDAAATGDRLATRLLATRAVADAVDAWWLAAGRRIPRVKDLARAVAAIDRELAARLDRFARASTSDEIVLAGGDVLERCGGARTFFEWESDRDPLPPPSP